ncbi:uncharacterized protein BJX67DRAFT_94418 [Aspergillus lucknowensis]|uniref:F-box domain-containing protein n=1 Tax=Aspergillus lucknowensis TaxID=176173 RepID=A0ABR4M5Q8_9EURO
MDVVGQPWKVCTASSVPPTIHRWNHAYLRRQSSLLETSPTLKPRFNTMPSDRMLTKAQSLITSLKPRPRLKYTARHRNGPVILTKRYISQRLWALRNRNRLSLLDLPVDILLLVFPLLPLLSQACLALTCRSLYNLFGYVLQDKSLAWPRQLASKGYRPLMQQPEILRNQLLFLLEDDYWQYCTECLKMHPRSRFPPWRTDDPRLMRSCEYFPKGVLDICPCLSLTFFDRVRLEECLCRGVLNPDLPRSIRHAFRLTRSKKQRFLIHECSINDHAHAFIALKTTFPLQGPGDLRLQTRYCIHLSLPRPFPRPDDLDYILSFPRFGMEPVLCCPHFDVLESLYRFDWVRDTCICCGTTVLETWKAIDGSCVIVECSRNLGGYTGEVNWTSGSRHEYNAWYRTWYAHHGAHT